MFHNNYVPLLNRLISLTKGDSFRMSPVRQGGNARARIRLADAVRFDAVIYTYAIHPGYP